MRVCHRLFKLKFLRLDSRLKFFQNGDDSRLSRIKATPSPKQRQEPLYVSVVADNSTVRYFLDGVVSGQEDPFFAVDVGRLFRLYKQWRNLLPRVDAFYGIISIESYMGHNYVRYRGVIFGTRW